MREIPKQILKPWLPSPPNLFGGEGSQGKVGSVDLCRYQCPLGESGVRPSRRARRESDFASDVIQTTKLFLNNSECPSSQFSIRIISTFDH